MFSYEIWDKKSDIKGFPASYWLKENSHLREGDVFLVKQSGTVFYVESVDVMRANLLMPENSTSDEVVQKYIDNMKKGYAQDPESLKRISELESTIEQLVLDSLNK